MKDLVFAVEAGSAGESEATANGFATMPTLDQATALLEVKSGTADAAVIDSLMAGAMVGEGTNYAELTYTIGLNSEEYGVGFRKGSDAVAEINKYFEEAYMDGTMMEIAETYGVEAAIIEQI
jgi:polar amino acid transport system substrate-binding protein